MYLKSGVVILILLLSMSMTKTTNGRLHEGGKYRKPSETNKLKRYNLPMRHHNHYFHKKHLKCVLDRLYYRPHGKKPSRYPTLDKIVDRLDNQIDHRSEKARSTTFDPLEDGWNAAKGTAFEDRPGKYSYVTVGLDDRSKSVNKVSSENPYDKDDWIDFDGTTLSTVKFGQSTTTTTTAAAAAAAITTSNKGFMQDFTTSSPWDNEQHDISSQGARDAKDSNASPSTPAKDHWALGRLVPRVTDPVDKQPKTTPLPYVAAHEHYEHVLRMADCHIPKEKVIRVHEVHPDPSKSYSPSCTILHQCADDTGCCRDLKQVCKPKNTTKVELYFFTTTLGKPQTVEKLHFVNHTECECQKRTDEAMPRDSEFRKSHFKKLISAKISEEKRKRNNCTCPSRYSSRYLANGTCVCDCFDKQDDCLVLKKGKAHFSYQDKLCIQQGMCLMPSCEFGSYIRRYGRCPNRSEKFHYSWSRALTYRDLIT